MNAVAEKEIRVTVRLRNNRLLTLREAAGMSQRQLATSLGVSLPHISRIENFGKVGGRGVQEHKSLEQTIQILAAFFGVDPGDLAPRELFAAIKVNQVDREIRRTDALAIAEQWSEMLALQAPDDPETNAIANERKSRFEKALESLTPREERIVRLHGAGFTFGEIGKKLSITGARVSAINMRALAKIQARVEPNCWAILHKSTKCDRTDCERRAWLRHECGSYLCDHHRQDHRCEAS